jgi:hypothetical protein
MRVGGGGARATSVRRKLADTPADGRVTTAPSAFAAAAFQSALTLLPFSTPSHRFAAPRHPPRQGASDA